MGTPTSLGSSVYEEEEEDSLSPNTFGYKLECRGEARAYRRHFLGKVSPGTLPEWALPWGGGQGTGAWGRGSLLHGSSVFSFQVLSYSLCTCVTQSLRNGRVSVRGLFGDHHQQVLNEVMKCPVLGTQEDEIDGVLTAQGKLCPSCLGD